jgi:anti-sigma factor ChrR (cupin superfamily)
MAWKEWPFGTFDPARKQCNMPDTSPDLFTGFLRFPIQTLALSRSEWPVLQPGVRQLILRDGPLPGERTSLLAYDPGAQVPRHRHVGEESLFILEGEQIDDSGAFQAGSYLINPVGTEHAVRSPGGCLVLIHWHAPVQFLEPLKTA